MSKTIELMVQRCEICAKRKTYSGRTKELLIPREDFGLLEQMIIDVAYFSEFKSRYKYLLVMIDRFSKLVSLVPLTKQDELSVAEAIKDHWLYKFGKPKSILSDRGRVFEGAILRKLTEKFGIKQEFTSP